MNDMTHPPAPLTPDARPPITAPTTEEQRETIDELLMFMRVTNIHIAGQHKFAQTANVAQRARLLDDNRRRAADVATLARVLVAYISNQWRDALILLDGMSVETYDQVTRTSPCFRKWLTESSRSTSQLP